MIMTEGVETLREGKENIGEPIDRSKYYITLRTFSKASLHGPIARDDNTIVHTDTS